ncbi:MAG TPA: hypothetical protein VHW45_10870 [Candidatus Sulfotelmatobacter sp.]|nr:hypothetical protein [Candidatus Sulfotelmatobacter sp.]
MASTHKIPPHDSRALALTCIARFPNLRALAWSGDVLYASRRYELLRAKVDDTSRVNWQPVATFNPGWKRKLSSANALTSRLFRDGFHALAILSSGEIVAAVPGAILSLRPGESEFRRTHKVTRGTRPLHITSIPGGAIFWGEYFDNASRDEVHIYGSSDGEAWSPAYTFQKGAIRHVHNIVHDPWADCLWVLTGDYGDECRILRAACDFSCVETVLQGNQQARAVAAVPTESGLLFSTDTPLEQNFIYHLDHAGNLVQLSPISNSSIYGCRAGANVFFSTMIEPSKVNRDREVRIYGAGANRHEPWQPLLTWQKDRWPMRFFQYGNGFFPDGHNATNVLAVTTIAVQPDDMAMTLYKIS